jgi:hypothetical protein
MMGVRRQASMMCIAASCESLVSRYLLVRSTFML